MALPEIEGAIGIPYGVVPWNREPRDVALHAEAAPAEIGEAQAHLRTDEPARALCGIADRVAARIHNRDAVFIRDGELGCIESRSDGGPLQLPERFEAEAACLHGVRPAQIVE